MGLLSTMKKDLPAFGKSAGLRGKVVDVDITKTEYGRQIFYLLENAEERRKADSNEWTPMRTEDGTFKVFVKMTKTKDDKENTAMGFPEHLESLTQLGINAEDYDDIDELVAAIGEAAVNADMAFTLWEKPMGKLSPAQNYVIATVGKAAPKATAKRGLPTRG